MLHKSIWEFSHIGSDYGIFAVGKADAIVRLVATTRLVLQADVAST